MMVNLFRYVSCKAQGLTFFKIVNGYVGAVTGGGGGGGYYKMTELIMLL